MEHVSISVGRKLTDPPTVMIKIVQFEKNKKVTHNVNLTHDQARGIITAMARAIVSNDSDKKSGEKK